MPIKSVFFLSLFSMAHAWAYESSHMNQFSMVQCHQETCLKASGDLAFVSMGQDRMVASKVKLEFRSSQSKSVKTYHCAVFQYDLRSQYLTCENQDEARAFSFGMDSNFKMFYSSLGKRNKS